MGDRRKYGNSGPIPKRWLNCPSKSDSFIADKFVAFKTPLSSKFDSQVEDKCFYPYMIFDVMKTFYKKKVGLWIDLTNTSRFYDRSEVEKKECRYVKLQCRGFGETPSLDQTQAFIELVDDFISQNPLEIVAVHCTHGFNRTGFLISSYLVERHDYAVEAALKSFSEARPPGIYKKEYISELYRRYEPDDEQEAVAPPLPDWCYEEEEEEDDQRGEASTSKRPMDDVDGGDDDEGKKKKKRRKEQLRLDAVFMNGVPGVTLMTNVNRVNELQEIAQRMCGWEKTGFPGSQPVSMTRESIVFLHQKPYMVSWKADGTRYMMLILQQQEIFFFDRDNSCFQVDNLIFPYYKDYTIHLKNTLLDGEMVIDIVEGREVPRYLVYDIVAYHGENYGERPFKDRLVAIKNLIIGPRHEAMKRGMIKREREPFSVRMKDFWDVTQAEALLGPKFAKQLSHEPDGLIFQPKMEPYIAGRCDDVLKWKPPEMNSVDFRLKIAEESGQGIIPKKMAYLYVGSLEQPFAVTKLTKNMKELHGKIIECKFDPMTKQWVFMRERTDKSYPNAYTTAKSVCHSIQYPVDKENLLKYIKNHRFADDSESMPPPDSHHHHHHHQHHH